MGREADRDPYAIAIGTEPKPSFDGSVFADAGCDNLSAGEMGTSHRAGMILSRGPFPRHSPFRIKSSCPDFAVPNLDELTLLGSKCRNRDTNPCSRQHHGFSSSRPRSSCKENREHEQCCAEQCVLGVFIAAPPISIVLAPGNRRPNRWTDIDLPVHAYPISLKRRIDVYFDGSGAARPGGAS